MGSSKACCSSTFAIMGHSFSFFFLLNRCSSFCILAHSFTVIIRYYLLILFQLMRFVVHSQLASPLRIIFLFWLFLYILNFHRPWHSSCTGSSPHSPLCQATLCISLPVALVVIATPIFSMLLVSTKTDLVNNAVRTLEVPWHDMR